MCKTCKEIETQLDTHGAPLDAAATKSAFAKIAAAIKKGRAYDHFEKLTNRLLGTEMASRDKDVEGRWEKGYRNTRSDNE